MVVLNAALSPDLDTPPPSPTTPKPPLRQTFTVDYDYDLFHIVLFNLYTGRISFSTSPSPSVATHPDLPFTTNAEGIYATSHRLQLDSLDRKAFHFLQATCTVENITWKVFSKFAEKHEMVGEMYDGYFLRNWDRVKRSKEFERFFEELEDGDFEEYIRVNRKFREMVRKCT